MTLLIDLSYFIFYRYYATLSWYKKQDDAIKDKSPMTDILFLEKYDKIFEQTVCDLQQKFGCLWKSIYFAKDCSRDEIWRNKHYTNYKSLREERLESFDKEIFKHTISVLIPKLQEKYKGAVMLHVDHMEADDIIAVVKKYIRLKNTTMEIIIITNDNDYIQLIDDYTLVVNLQGKDLKTRIDCTPEEYLNRKIIMGDKSDNIPSIAKKIGEKTSAKLATDETAILNLFKKNPDAKIQYDLNKLLISFDMIPENLHTIAIENYIRTL